MLSLIPATANAKGHKHTAPYKPTLHRAKVVRVGNLYKYN